VILIVLGVHLLLFVLTPPFHFKPYELEAEELMVVQEIPEFQIPDPPRDVPLPQQMPNPIDDPEGQDIELPSIEKIFNQPPPPPRAPKRPPYLVFDEEPEVIEFVTPDYPDLARQAGLEGTVMVRVTIGIDGKVIGATVVHSDVTDTMEREALRAAMLCKFKPAKQQNKPVRVDVVIPFIFRLESCR
jgi:protein TonB